MKVKVISLEKKAAGEVELDDAIFALTPREDLLTRMVNWQRAKRQRGTHKTKGVSEISGSTRKPFRQKGTGRARRGSLRAGLLRGGQTTHGPVVRSHAHDLPKKLRKLALRHALSAKQRDGKLVVLDKAVVKAPKTKPLAAKLAKLGWSSALIVDGDGTDENFRLAARNIPEIDLLPQIGANVYDILRRDILVLTRDAVEKLQERL